MRHFYKLIEGNLQTALMTSIMQKQDRFTLSSTPDVDELLVLSIGVSEPRDAIDADGAREFPALRRLSLAVLQATDGVALRQSVLLRIAPKANAVLGGAPDGIATYAMFLHAAQGALLMAKEEAVPVRSGDLWWTDKDASLLNKSDDEVFMLVVEVRV